LYNLGVRAAALFHVLAQLWKLSVDFCTGQSDKAFAPRVDVSWPREPCSRRRCPDCLYSRLTCLLLNLVHTFNAMTRWNDVLYCIVLRSCS